MQLRFLCVLFCFPIQQIYIIINYNKYNYSTCIITRPSYSPEYPLSLKLELFFFTVPTVSNIL